MALRRPEIGQALSPIAQRSPVVSGEKLPSKRQLNNPLQHYTIWCNVWQVNFRLFLEPALAAVCDFTRSIGVLLATIEEPHGMLQRQSPWATTPCFSAASARYLRFGAKSLGHSTSMVASDHDSLADPQMPGLYRRLCRLLYGHWHHPPSCCGHSVGTHSG